MSESPTGFSSAQTMVVVSRRSTASVSKNTILAALCMFIGFGVIFMGLGFSTGRTGQSLRQNIPSSDIPMESRLRGALWAYFAGDALASPTHWYYGGFKQIQRDYGEITDYTKPKEQLPGSILNKSNVNGGGRSAGSSSSKRKEKTIIGDIINHGKLDLWSPSKNIHYHATLQAGENTLEVSLARVLMKSIVAKRGNFDPDHFRQAYMEFMMRPGSHNDTYASTCHRMFFANLVLHHKQPEDCPDNDSHNVDTIDGIVLPTIVSLAATAKGKSVDQVQQEAASCASVTRKSSVLARASSAWSTLVYTSLHESNVLISLQETARRLGFRKPVSTKPDEITACYLDSSMPALLDSIAKYQGSSPWRALLANANTGGENVHRGSCLGAVLGANVGMEDLEPQLRNGLYHSDELAKEIDEFVEAVLSSAS